MVSTSGGTGLGYASMSRTLNAQRPPPTSRPAIKSTRAGQRSATDTSRRIISQHPQEQDAPAHHDLIAALEARFQREVFAAGNFFSGDGSTLKAQAAVSAGADLSEDDRLFTHQQDCRTLDCQF